MRKSYEEVCNILKENGCELLSKRYVNAKTNLEMKCSCKNIFRNTLYKMNRNGIYMCESCRSNKRKQDLRLTYSEVVNYVKSIGYELLTNEEEYIDTKQKVKLKCNLGHDIELQINKLRSGRRCKICSSLNRKPNVPYEERIKMVDSFGYKLLTKKEDYKKLHSKVKLMCQEGHIYEANLSDFQQGCRCPLCTGYRGENIIIKYLDSRCINYKFQNKFEDCKFKNKLHFDFYLPENNICIEFDGKQHFEFKNTWGGLEGFVDRKIRDTIKDLYCKDKGVKLIRIPYWEIENIETILNKELKYDNTEITNLIKIS